MSALAATRLHEVRRVPVPGPAQAASGSSARMIQMAMDHDHMVRGVGRLAVMLAARHFGARYDDCWGQCSWPSKPALCRAIGFYVLVTDAGIGPTDVATLFETCRPTVQRAVGRVAERRDQDPEMDRWLSNLSRSFQV